MTAINRNPKTAEELANFFFDREIKLGDKEKWYWNDGLASDCDPNILCELYIALFSNSKHLLEQFSRDQLEEGFWAIPGCNTRGAVSEIIWDERVSLTVREQCIKSMYFLYKDLFSVNPLHTSSNMWWDSLACCQRLDHPSGSDSDEERRIRDSMFETLCLILNLDSIACQAAALHGLGHLRHPETERVINAWLNANPDLPEEDVDYAKACIDGDIM